MSVGGGKMDLFAQKIALEYGDLQLQVIDAGLQAELNTVGEDATIWQTFAVSDYVRQHKKQSYTQDALTEFTAERRYPLVISLAGKVIGCSNFYEYDKKNGHAKIGYTWFVPEVWGTKVNPICKYLMLQYAFETLQLVRVAFTVDSKNLQSQRAVLKLGAKQEGILRHIMTYADGSYTDSVIFSILREEWPEVKTRLEQRISDR
jgi:N-acetyltransferase